MLTADQNFRLVQEIEANRIFLRMALQQNLKLLVSAEPRIKQIFEALPPVRAELKHAAIIKQRGVSLIELIMFIVIISVAVAGILLVMNKVSAHSADTLIRKQALAIAESFLEEIELQGVSGVAPTVLPRSNFDNVFNYNGYATTGIVDMAGGTITGLENYSVAVQVALISAAPALGNIPINSASAVMITVTVTDPTTAQIVLTGYRAGN
ncbi:MAG: hypothetical protein Q7S51_02275 [Gallionellaceae bacterium]|nr:hypothetical protein [Gallionellaceae bacterium]